MTSGAKPPANYRIEVKDYGDMLAKLRDMRLVFYRELGSCQGKYLCVLLDEGDSDDPKRLFVYRGSYGSCSGCDWIQSELDWGTSTVDYKQANEYCAQMKPLYILPARPYAAGELLAIIGEDDSYDFEFGQAEAAEIAECIASALVPPEPGPLT